MSDRGYIVFCRSGSDGYNFNYMSSDPYDDDSVKSCDQKLHRTLSEIFSERRLTSDQIRKLIRAPRKLTDKNSIFELILEREPEFGDFEKGNKLSLLWLAVLSCYQDSVELLVRSGADVNELCRWRSSTELTEKSSVLHVLLRMYPSSWNERFCSLLIIDHGADLQAQDVFGNTVLHVALRNSRIKLAEMLLERGADVNAADISGATPLLKAASHRNADELVPLLMAHGADVKAKDQVGSNVLHHLADAPVAHTDLARVFIEKGVSLRDRVKEYKYQPIHVAVLRRQNELVKLYLEHGANVNKKAYGGEFLLRAAAEQCGNTELLLILLKAGANIDLKDRARRTALHSACEPPWFHPASAVEKIKILLSVGADMFVGDCVGKTPFDLLESKDLRNTLMLKTLALRKASLQPSAELKDEKIVKEKYPEHSNYYQDCVEEINRTKSTRFIETCTMFELLTKCQCLIEPLMRHLEFENRFRLFDRSVFPLYAEDIVEAFERAKRYYQSILDQEEVINEAVYNSLPSVIVRKVVRYVFNNCEICEMKKTVRASRRAPDGTNN